MDSIFPFINPETVALADNNHELPLFREYAYDFVNNCLLQRDGRTYLVEGNEALQIWIYKALHTARYKFVAYSRAYGSEIKTLIGLPIQEEVLLPELQRYIVETLMANPYIVELANFEFAVDGAEVTVQFDCTTRYGQLGSITYIYDEGGAG